MAISVGDVLKVTAKWIWDGATDMLNVFTCVVGSPPANQAQAIDAVIEWIEGIYSNILVDISNDVVADNITIFNMTDDVLETISPWDTIAVGGAAPETLPSGTAGYVFARTGKKRARGRHHFPVFTEGSQADSLLIGAVTTRMAAAVSDWINDFTSAAGVDLIPGVWSESTVPVIDVGFEPFLNGVVIVDVGYQRRRKLGVGS